MKKFIIPESKSELKEMIKQLDAAGFYGHNAEETMHKSRVDKIIAAANPLHVKYPDNLIRLKDWHLIDKYADLQREAEKYFSTFSKDDKIIQLLEKVSIAPADKVYKSRYKDSITIEEAFKKYGKFESPLDIDGRVQEWFNIYDLRPNVKKIKVTYASGNLRDAVHLIYGSDVLQYKRFENGNTDVTGDIAKLKEYLIKALTNKYHIVIS